MNVGAYARSLARQTGLGLVALIVSGGAALAEPTLRAVETLAEPAGIASIVEYSITLEDIDALATSPALVLYLPEGRLVAERDALEHQPHGLYWTGHFPDGRQVLLTIYDGLPSGLVYTAGHTYEISPGPVQPRLAELDTGAFPPCATDSDDVSGPGGPVGPPLAADADASGIAVMDALVVYTPEARDGVGGVSEIETVIQSAVNITNTAYQNSQVEAHLYLIHTALAPFGDSGSSSTDLSTVRNDDVVASIRDAYGADLVGLIAHDIDGCGRGGVQRNPGPGFASRAFQVTQRSCAVGNLSFAHEFGHNQGCEHDPANGTSPGNASFPFAFGHFQSGAFRTVMSYSSECENGCPRAPYISNSKIQNGGLDTGVLDERENYRTINNTASIVAAFRPSAVTLDLGQAVRTVREDEGSIEIRVARRGRDDIAVTAQLILRDVEAQADLDYEPRTYDLSWAAGDTSTKTITIDIIDDAVVEGPETFEAALSGLRGAGVGDVDVSLITIADWEPGEIGFSQGAYDVDENAGTLEVVLQRRQGTDGESGVAVGLVEIAGGATRGDDFERETGGVVAFPEGVDEASVRISIRDDKVLEGDERFRIQITGVSGSARVGAPAEADVFIRDYEEGSFRFEAAEQTVLEDDGDVEIVVLRADGEDGPASVDFEVRDGSAERNADFEIERSGTLTWGDGDGRPQRITLETIDDDDLEDDETLTIVLSQPDGAALGTPAELTVTLKDREPGEVGGTAATATVAEPAGLARIPVVRRDGDQGAVALPWVLEPVTAEAEADYTPVQGTLRWEDGEMGTKFVEVPILDDDKSDAAETFVVQLGPVDGTALLVESRIEVTIVDDEPEGCGCTAAETHDGGHWAWLALGALAFARRRRR